MHDEERNRSPWGRPGERPGAPRAQDQLAEQGVRPRPPAATTAHAVSSWADQQIQQAQRQGAFENLPGAGRPLRDVDTRADPDWWVRGLVEREKLDLSAALPGVLQLRREKAALPETLRDLSDEAEVRARLEDFNERVLADRRRPHVGPHPPPVVGRVDVEQMLQVWRTSRAAHPSPQRSDARVEDVGVTDDRDARRAWWPRRRRRDA